MRRQTFSATKATQQLMSAVVSGVKSNHRISDIALNIRTIVNSFNGLKRNERSKLYNNALNLARRAKASGKDWTRVVASSGTAYDPLMSISRRVDASVSLRRKHSTLGADISNFENENGYEPIFYVCSYHSNCAKDHSDYQGKIYIDRFWRAKVGSSDYYKVLAYIKNRNILTIQQVVKSPIWLTTRPYCKHYFVPVATADVLSSSPKKILHQYGAYHYTPDYYTNDDYFQTRKQIYTQLNSIFPCDEFRRLIRR